MRLMHALILSRRERIINKLSIKHWPQTSVDSVVKEAVTRRSFMHVPTFWIADNKVGVAIMPIGKILNFFL